jgi:hypothetical protein
MVKVTTNAIFKRIKRKISLDHEKVIKPRVQPESLEEYARRLGVLQSWEEVARSTPSSTRLARFDRVLDRLDRVIEASGIRALRVGYDEKGDLTLTDGTQTLRGLTRTGIECEITSWPGSMIVGWNNDCAIVARTGSAVERAMKCRDLSALTSDQLEAMGLEQIQVDR